MTPRRRKAREWDYCKACMDVCDRYCLHRLRVRVREVLPRPSRRKKGSK